MARERIELVRSNHPQASDNTFETPQDAIAFLTEAARSKANFEHFQAIWQDHAPKVRSLSPQQSKMRMFKQLAEQLAEGTLRLREVRSFQAEVPDREKPQPFAEARTTWQMGSHVKIRERTPPPPPRPEPETDIGQQIAALRRAAQSGAPFCEQCQAAAGDTGADD